MAASSSRAPLAACRGSDGAASNPPSRPSPSTSRPVDATSASISRPRGVSDDVRLPRVRASTEREPGTCDVHVSPTRGARGFFLRAAAVGARSHCSPPSVHDPFKSRRWSSNSCFEPSERENERHSPRLPGTKLSFSHGAQSRKRGISLKKVYPVHIRFFVTRAGGRGCDSGS